MNIFSKVKDKVKITDIINDYLLPFDFLEKDEKYLVGLCPFNVEGISNKAYCVEHENQIDKGIIEIAKKPEVDLENPFVINKEKNIFYCFCCGCGGDTIALMSKIINISSYRTAKVLAKLYKIDISEKDNLIEIKCEICKSCEDAYENEKCSLDSIPG